MVREEVLLDTTRVSNSRSLRISVPKRVAERIKVTSNDIIGFYWNSDGEVIIKKLE